MTSREIRQGFIDFFRERGHEPVASSPLVPHGDPTLLFTNAGMVQFKDYFLGRQPPPFPRAVSSQRCLRVSGKHNDLENVGPSPRHHTFFEMLGNFSFGDYFKAEAIEYAWKLVTDTWGLDPAVLSATVFEEDEEAAALWLQISGLPPDRVHRCGAADNFWAMGETGPCGPCSEIFVDRTPEQPEVSFEEGSESGRYLEIWNLVFMELERDESGRTTRLPNPSIDTGAGLERVAAVLQGVESNYDTDLFQPIIAATAELAEIGYGDGAATDVAMRVVADHLRAVSFLITDGVVPSNEGRGYVVRRLLRRAARHGMRLGFEGPFLHRLVPVLEEVMGDAYPELGETESATVATVRGEEEKFLATIAAGARQVQEAIEANKSTGILPGAAVFRLYDTFGLPVEVIHEIAEEEQMEIDETGFERELDSQRTRSRAATGDQQRRTGAVGRLLAEGDSPGATEFDGYTSLVEDPVTVLRVIGMGTDGPVASSGLSAGERGLAVFGRTVFYAEAGGQVGDRGSISWEGGHARVLDTQKDTAGHYLHEVEVDAGVLAPGLEVRLEVAADRRRDVERHHTGTHLLHAALRDVLGDTVRQAGSLVDPDRLRFDFTFAQPVTDDERRRIEDLVNGWILEASAATISEHTYDEAVARGAMALFGEKYGERVRMVEIPEVSLELCGGCHVRNTGEIGPFVITAERGVASGVRRIEAIAGRVALAAAREREALVKAVESALGTTLERAPAEIIGLEGRLKAAVQESSRLRQELVAGESSRSEVTTIGAVQVLVQEVPMAASEELRNLADVFRQRLGSGVVVLGARDEQKVSLIVAVTADLTDRVHAGRIVKSIAALVGGGGGGRPDFAQAGGREPEKLEAALAAVDGVVKGELEGA